MRHSDRVKLACLAQLVNVIAPIMTNADGLLRQTIYYPYSWGLQYAHGAVLNLLVESSSYDVNGMDHVPHVDASATFNHDAGSISMFLLNRDLSSAHEVEIVWEGGAPGEVLASSVLTGTDLKASNTFATPQHVTPQPFEKPTVSGGRTRLELPARSYTIVQWSL